MNDDNVMKLSVSLNVGQVTQAKQKAVGDFQDINRAAQQVSQRAQQHSDQMAAFWLKAMDKIDAANAKLYAKQNAAAKASAQAHNEAAQKSASDRARHESEYAKTWERILRKKDEAAERSRKKAQAEENRLQREVQDSLRKTQRLSQEAAEVRARAARMLADVEIKEDTRKANAVLRILNQVNRQRQNSGRGNGSRGGGGSNDPDGPFGGAGLSGLLTRGAAVGLGIVGIQNLTGAASSGARAWFEYSASLEQTTIGFETLLGSAAAAQAHIRELQEFAVKTPFEFRDIAEASQKLQAMGVELKNVLPLLNAIGNAVSAAGGGAEQFERVVYAFADIQARGKLTGEEIRQLANNRIPVIRALAEELKVTDQQVLKLAEDGKISAQVFNEAFKRFAENRFGDAMEKQSHTFNGALSNIKDALLVTSNTAFKPLFERISRLADEMAQNMRGQDFEGSARILVEKLGTGLGEGITQVFRLLGKGAADSFRLMFLAQLSDDNFLIKAAKYVQSPFTGIVEGITGIRIGQSAGQKFATAALSEVTNSAARGTQETNKPLLDNSAEIRRKTLELIKDLERELQFFGQKSEEAALRQKMLAAGIKDLNDPLAQQVILLARRKDALEHQAELDELERKRVQERDKQIRQDLSSWADHVTQQMLLVNADLGNGVSELDKFNITIANKAEAHLKYTDATLKSYREMAKNLDASNVAKTVRDELKSLDEQLYQLQNTTEDGVSAFARYELFVMRNGGAAKFTKKELENLRDAYQELFDLEQKNKRDAKTKTFLESLTDINREALKQLNSLQFMGGNEKTPLDDLLEKLSDLKDLKLMPDTFRSLLDPIRSAMSSFQAGIFTDASDLHRKINSS
jgi:tape measure domain-containing protein